MAVSNVAVNSRVWPALDSPLLKLSRMTSCLSPRADAKGLQLLPLISFDQLNPEGLAPL